MEKIQTQDTRGRANKPLNVTVDSDGNIEELIPLWLESGVNGFLPLEVAANMDAISMRKQYGRNIVLIGNIDKRALIGGKEAIKREVEHKRGFKKNYGNLFLRTHLLEHVHNMIR